MVPSNPKSALGVPRDRGCEWMTGPIQLSLLVRREKDAAGSIERLAQVLGVSAKTVGDWLKKDEDELRHIHKESIDLIMEGARRLKVDVESCQECESLWDLKRSYVENLNAPVPPPPSGIEPFKRHKIPFMDTVVNSRLVAGAGLFTSTSVRIHYLAATGVDVFIFKTVRSREHRHHRSPNLLFCKADTRLRSADPRGARVDVGELSPSYNPAFGVFNRLGVPSNDAPSWQAEFKTTAEGLAPGQKLVLSVAGSRAPDGTSEDLVNDFVCVVGLAVEAGARVVELNLSCPNSAASPLYRGLDLTLAICRAVAQSISGTRTKILLKIGYMLGNELYNFVMSTAEFCDGYTAINSVPVEGFQQGPYGQEPAFGQLGVRAGLSGPPILDMGLHCARELAEIKERRQLRNLLICGGGVQDKESARRYLHNGADFVFLNSIFFVNPNAAIDIRRYLDRTWQEKESNALRTENALFEWSRAVTTLIDGAAGSSRRHAAILTASNAELVEWFSRWERTTAGPQRIEQNTTADFFIERIRARLQDDTERA